MEDINGNKIDVQVGDIYEIQFEKSIYVIKIDISIGKWCEGKIIMAIKKNRSDYSIGDDFLIDDGEIIKKL